MFLFHFHLQIRFLGMTAANWLWKISTMLNTFRVWTLQQEVSLSILVCRCGRVTINIPASVAKLSALWYTLFLNISNSAEVESPALVASKSLFNSANLWSNVALSSSNLWLSKKLFPYPSCQSENWKIQLDSTIDNHCAFFIKHPKVSSDAVLSKPVTITRITLV